MTEINLNESFAEFDKAIAPLLQFVDADSAIHKKFKEFKELMAVSKGVKKEPVFDPETGQRYWLISETGGVHPCRWDNDIVDKARYAIGNCYQSEASALHELNRRKVIRRLEEMADFVPDWENNGQRKYYPVHDHNSKHWMPAYTNFRQRSTIPHFRTDAELLSAIETIGDDMNYLLAFKGE